jgi:hypothetical protein
MGFQRQQKFNGKCKALFSSPNTLDPEGGLFTRSGSAAHPFFVEQLSVMSYPKNHSCNSPEQLAKS